MINNWKWYVVINETCAEWKMSSFRGSLGLLLFICDPSRDLRQLTHLWSYVDRNFSRRSICSMGMWQPGTSWSSAISPLSSVAWAWLMKSTPEGPSPLLARYLSSGLPRSGFCWEQPASRETCTVCSCPLGFFLSWPGCPPIPEHAWVCCQFCLHMPSLLRSQTSAQAKMCITCQGIWLRSLSVPFEVFPLY